MRGSVTAMAGDTALVRGYAPIDPGTVARALRPVPAEFEISCGRAARCVCDAAGVR